MNKFKNILIVLFATLLFAGCDEEDPQLLPNSQAFVKFESSTASVPETDDILKVVVQVSDVSRSADVTVDFDFDLTDISNQAIAGEDFMLMNASKTLTFPKGVYQDTIFIKTVDNDLYEKDKAFNIVLKSNSANYKIGLADSEVGTTIACNIVDNEHPLATWIGTYSVAAVSYNKPGEWDEAWTVTAASDPNNVNNLILTGIAGSTTPVTAKVDVTNMTITISSRSSIGDAYGYADSFIVKGLTNGGGAEEDIVGTINNDGSMQMDIAVYLLDTFDPGYQWDSFNSIWTK